jgi:DNA polymerase elongation subunit (family B)
VCYSDVTYRLADANCLLLNIQETSRLTCTNMMDLMTKGEQIKTWNLISQQCHKKGWLVNYDNLRALKPRMGTEFTGGKVQDPKVGFYKRPIATLDFNSL